MVLRIESTLEYQSCQLSGYSSSYSCYPVSYSSVSPTSSQSKNIANIQAAWLAISSCLFANFRARLSARKDIESASLHLNLTLPEDEALESDKHYFRAMAEGGAALDEFIEMRNLMHDPPGEEYD